MSSLDQMVKSYVTPGMQAAGFEKVGRLFRAIGESGDHAFIWYSERKSRQPGAVIFVVTASILTTTYWAFVNREEPDPGPLMPGWLGNSLVLDVEAPREAALHPDAEYHHLRRRWAYDTETKTACGEVLANCMADDLAPWLVRRLDRGALLEEIERPTRPWRGAPHGTAAQAVLALLDDGPLSEIDRRLPEIKDVTMDGSFTAWIAARLATRRGAGDV